ncbi:TetR/AcrR family transcriptional regulator [Fructobacillus tropaeoli]|uniref:Transcriptional regulator n=1 Tax=Fructobacillus tropaeoli TaxID=709323 RepID=A0A3F3H7P4_9LACO|nr:TetR/AcrR family transcriptional regulator [Fructobacillus tropaeoli]GAP03998.1 transcriptional regulator [Fructobacillus tropaeoli]
MIKTEKEKINRQKIIQTAELLISKYHRSDITLNQIASELGVTHATIYKHFKNKKELWEAVSKKWFQEVVVRQIDVGTADEIKIKRLHKLLWSFVSAKKNAYNQDEAMFILNTEYVENNPIALQEILKSVYQKINTIMDWPDNSFANAELILSAFSVFTLPTFRETWNNPDFYDRFESMWQLVCPGIEAMSTNE